MLNILRLSKRFVCAAASSKVNLQQLQCYASFTLRDIVHHDALSESGSTVTHFAKHIALERLNGQDLVTTTVRYVDYFPVMDMRIFRKELKRTSADQLPALIIFAFTYRPSADPGKFAIVLNELDAHCCAQLPQMDINCIINTLYSFLFLVPHWMPRLDFYYAALNQLVTQDFKENARKELFVQLCFYLGLGKPNINNQQSGINITKLLQQMNQYLDFYLPNLSSTDLSIVCDANFKTSTNIESKLLPQRLEKEINTMPLDASTERIFITMIKFMRFQRWHYDSNCVRLSQLLQDKNVLQSLDSIALIHLFTFFAENRWPANEFQNGLIAEFLTLLQNDADSAIRGKDIASFLWCCAQLGCPLTEAQMQQIENILLMKIRQHELRQHADVIVDCCLYLWMLGYKSRTLLEEAVIAKTQPSQRNMRDKKQLLDNKINVLLSAVAIEESAYLKVIERIVNTPSCDFVSEAPAYTLKDRADLLEYKERLENETDIEAVRVVCPIKGINIPVLSVQFKAPVNNNVLVTLLKEDQLLRHSKLPIAIIRLQIRLFEALKQNVAVLEPADIANDYTNLKNMLFDDTDDVIAAAEEVKETQVSNV